MNKKVLSEILPAVAEVHNNYIQAIQAEPRQIEIVEASVDSIYKALLLLLDELIKETGKS